MSTTTANYDVAAERTRTRHANERLEIAENGKRPGNLSDDSSSFLIERFRERGSSRRDNA